MRTGEVEVVARLERDRVKLGDGANDEERRARDTAGSWESGS